MTSPRLGSPIDIRLSSRYYQFNRSFAIRDVYDALVELITNADDSYHRLFKRNRRNSDGGPILIEYLEQRKGKPSVVVIRDRAEGMSLKEMMDKLGEVGTRRSEEGDRGFMARGAKDCTELGSLTVESIKDDRLYKCQLTQVPQFVPLLNGNKVTSAVREGLHIQHGNGTVITLEISQNHAMPRFENLIRDLPWHYALRDVLGEHSGTKVLIRNLNRSGDGSERIAYQQPEGELVCQLVFEIPEYNAAKASLNIWRSTEPFEDSGERFRRAGILIKGERAIHECSLLSQEFERDPYARRYFGRIECAYIDKLLRDFDRRRERGEQHDQSNPSLVIDPNRQQGLIRDHPFVKALLLIPSEQLRALIAKDRELDRSKKQQIENENTRNRLSRLAKKASEFLKQQVEDLQELTADDDVDKSAFTKQGVFIYPTYFKVAVDEERTLTYYAKASRVTGEKPTAHVDSDDPALEILDTAVELRPHKTKEDRYLASFRVRGVAPKETIIIRAALEGLPSTEAIGSVIENRIEEHTFDSPLEFAHREYRVREGSRRGLDLYARYPEVVADVCSASVVSSDNISVPIRGTCRLEPVAGSNYARGTVVVQGRKLNAKAEITATINDRRATTEVRVVQSPPETTTPLKIELRDEDFGNFRARWADHEGKPNVLLVSARHKSLARYLGPPPEYAGQEHPVFRVLLAEVVAESVCRKSLLLESRERTWEFRWADLKEDHLIADDVIAKLQQRIRDFVSEAHLVMLSDAEFRRDQAN